MNYKITSNRVLIKLLPKNKTKSGIFLPSGNSANPFIEGEVILIGPEVKSVKIKDTVYLFPLSLDMGVKFNMDGEEFLIIRDVDIILVEDRDVGISE